MTDSEGEPLALQEWQSALEVDERKAIASEGLGVLFPPGYVFPNETGEEYMNLSFEDQSAQRTHERIVRLVTMPQAQQMTIEEFTAFCKDTDLEAYLEIFANETQDHSEILKLIKEGW